MGVAHVSSPRPLSTSLREGQKHAVYLPEDSASFSGCLFSRWVFSVEVAPQVAVSTVVQCMQVAFLEVSWSGALVKWCQTTLLG